MPVRRVGGGGRAVGVRRPTVVVRPMPIAPMMMTGLFYKSGVKLLGFELIIYFF